MKKILDKFITGFFIVTLGIAWYCSSKYQVKQEQYKIVIYDVFGKQVDVDGIRTKFGTYKVATNYISEYQERFPHYDFSMATEIPEIKKGHWQEFLKRIRCNEFSYGRLTPPHTG